MALPLLAGAQSFSSGSDGSDGAFNPQSDMTFDVTQAEYNFTTIDIPQGVTVTFNPDLTNNSPVVWLASGDVTIAGTINADGEQGHDCDAAFFTRSVGGPGGWSGGTGAQAPIGDPDVSLQATAGHGPGGGREAQSDFDGGNGAGHLNPGNRGQGSQPNDRIAKAYGNSFGVPLQGGSGGGGGGFQTNTIVKGSGGGAGGGALLIASSGDIAVSGSISADGGESGGRTTTADCYFGGGGSGGFIRLVANDITVSGSLSARGGSGVRQDSTSRSGGDGSLGRIRLDAFTFDLSGSSVPNASTGPPVLLDLPSAAPRLTIATIGGNAVPSDPSGTTSNPDVTIMSSDPVAVVVNAANIPIGTTVDLLVFAANGPSAIVTTSGLTGSVASSTATANVTFQPGTTQIVATAQFTPSKSLTAPNGEAVASVRISSTADGQQEVAYTTVSGEVISVSQ
ncbi:MAG: hypothetical protein RLY93_17450 [Sumerlaeia bacterium]